jgi:large repetitive protein
VVTAEFFSTPNAGSTTQESFCQNEDAVNLVDFINDSQLGEPDQTGYFTPALSTGTNMFNPADYAPGSYTFTYTIEGNDDCPTDTSQITVTVQEVPNAGEDTTLIFCQNEFEPLLQQILTNSEQAEATFASLIGDDVDTDGDFANDDLETIVNNYLLWAASDPIISFNAQTTYTVSNENGCANSSEITLTVNPSPNAGEDVTIYLEDRDDSAIDLLAELGGDPGGTWDTGDGTFDPTSDTTPASFTYTVTADNGCTASATVSIFAVQEDCPEVTEPIQRFCASIGEGNNFRRPNVSDLEPASATWYATADSTDPLPSSTLLVDGETYFAGTTTGNCENRASVTVEIFDTPNAGGTTTVNVCSNEAEFDLVSRINNSVLGPPQTTGYFSPALSTGTHIFNPEDYAPGSYTFKYVVEGNDDCPTDDTVVYVNVKAAPNAGEDVNETFCVADVSEIINNQQDFIDLYSDDNRTEGGTFTPSLEQLAAQFTDNPYGTFATVYSVTANGCTDTANLSVTIIQEEPANAGGNVEVTLCSTDGIQDLEDFLGSEAITGGTFSAPYEDGTFDPSTAGTDPVVITYTVGEDDACVTGSDSATITINVIEGPNAGEDGSITLNLIDDPVNLFDSLGGTPDTGGTWTPGSEDGELDPSSFYLEIIHTLTL